MKQLFTILIVGLILWYGFTQVTSQNQDPTIRGISNAPDLTIDGHAVTEVFAFSNAKVLDGDSVRLTDQNGGEIDIRLASIDAPETAQSFGVDSKQYLQQLLGTSEVIAWTIGTDRYDRQLAFLFLEEANGQLFEINSQMIRAGYAWHYSDHSDNPVLRSLEFDARSAQLGLWNDTQQPVPPWEFRRR